MNILSIAVLNEQANNKVFVSYAQDTAVHMERVLNFCNELCSLYIDCNCDQYIVDGNPPRGFPHWMSENIRVSQYVLVIPSEKYLLRYEGREEKGKGLGAKWEATLTSTEIYFNDGENMKFIPILFEEEDKQYIPDFLKPYTYYTISKEDRFQELVLRLKGELKPKKPTPGSPANSSYRKHAELGADATKSTLIKVPNLPQFTESMKPGMKILQAFFALPVQRRFQIAKDMGLTESGETYTSANADDISGQFLLRAKERNQLAALWDILFKDKDTDPNPFK